MRSTVIGRVRGRRAIAVALGAAALVALSAVPASGHKQGYDTSLQLKVDTLTATSTQYAGSVRSEKPACERNREITITTGGVAIGTATSDFNGDYTVVINGTPPAKNQDVIASTPKKFLKRNSKHRHKCRAATVTRKATGPPA
jgi:hypothetical protein